MNAALRCLVRALLAGALFAAAGAQAQIAYRAGSAASALSTDVTYVGQGGFAGADNGNIVAPLPPGWQVNDFWLALIESRDNVASTMPAGWTLLSQGSGAGGLHQGTLFWKRAAAGDTNPTITHPGGGKITAKIVGFRRVDLDQPFDVLHSFTGSGADTTTEAASITTLTQSLLVFTAHSGAYGTGAGSLAGSSPWYLGTYSKQGGSGDGVSLELHYSDMRVAGAQAALTLTRAEAGESHGALLALRPDKKLIVARPGSVAPNDLMLTAVGRWGTGSVTPPSGWTLVRRTENSGGALEVFFKVATASEPASYTFTAEAKGGTALGMQVFSGVDAANPIDVENGAVTASGLSHAAPSLTTTLANTMLVSSHTFMASDSWTPPTGMTETVDVSTYAGPVLWGLSLEMNYAAQAAAGATGAKSATVTVADSGYAHLLALRPSANTAKLYYIHADNLNTTRLVADDQQRAVWRWDNAEPFGDSPPDENPSALGIFKFPLRFLGTYDDPETNGLYNYFRDLDRSLGRYRQSDPIGLRGGPNSYSHVASSPLLLSDRFGLQAAIPAPSPMWGIPGRNSGDRRQSRDASGFGNELFPEAGRKPGFVWPDWLKPWMNSDSAEDGSTTPPERGLPPTGVKPPIPDADQCKPGPASRPSEQKRGGKSLWDPRGGEWRYFPGDRWHNPHWDHNPHDRPGSPWQNIPIGDLSPVKPSPG